MMRMYVLAHSHSPFVAMTRRLRLPTQSHNEPSHRDAPRHAPRAVPHFRADAAGVLPSNGTAEPSSKRAAGSAAIAPSNGTAKPSPKRVAVAAAIAPSDPTAEPSPKRVADAHANDSAEQGTDARAVASQALRRVARARLEQLHDRGGAEAGRERTCRIRIRSAHNKE